MSVVFFVTFVTNVELKIARTWELQMDYISTLVTKDMKNHEGHDEFNTATSNLPLKPALLYYIAIIIFCHDLYSTSFTERL